METARSVESKISGIVGLRLWGIKRGIGTFLTFEAGKLDRERSSTGIDHGEWHLWIRMAYWRLSRGSQIIASALETDEDNIGLPADLFGDERPIIESIAVGRQLHDLSIKCSEGLAIDVYVATSCADDEQWAIYCPDRQVISSHGDGRILVGE